MGAKNEAYSFAGGDSENLGGEADGAFHAEVTIAATSDEVTRD